MFLFLFLFFFFVFVFFFKKKKIIERFGFLHQTVQSGRMQQVLISRRDEKEFAARNAPTVCIPPPEPTFDADERRIYADLKRFALNTSADELHLPPTTSSARKKAHQLAMEFEFAHESVGRGVERHVAVRKQDTGSAAELANHLMLAIEQYKHDCATMPGLDEDESDDESGVVGSASSTSAVPMRAARRKGSSLGGGGAALASAAVPPVTPSRDETISCRMVEWNIEVCFEI